MFFLSRLSNSYLLNNQPTLYYIMQSICNFDKNFLETDYIKVNKLAEKSREKIFDFSYPITENLIRKDFEIDILEHFINRKIAQDTFINFQITLKNTLRAIMPKYNLMVDLLSKNMDIFSNTSEKNINQEKENKGSYTNNRDISENKTNNGSFSTNDNDVISDTTDKRFSDTPQNNLSSVASGQYLTTYNLDKYNKEDKRNISNSHSDVDISKTDDDLSNVHTDTDEMTQTEKYKETYNLFEKLKSFEDYSHIMSMIYDDIDKSCFLQIL